MIFSKADSSIMAGFAILFSILGFLFNFVTILSVNFADLIYIIFVLPMLATRYYTRQSESEVWSGLCKLFPTLFYLVLGASILSLMSVTINRTCILLFQERTEKIFNGRMRNLIVLLCWILPFAFLLPSILGLYGTMDQKPYTQSCTIRPDEDGRSPKTLIYNIFIFVPCTVMIICNIIILVKVKVIAHSGTISENRKAENIFILMLFMVFLFFVLTLFPSWAVDHFDKCFQHPTIHAIAYMLNWTGVIINPIIFMVTQRSYREAVRGLFKRLFVRVKKKDTIESTVMHVESFVND